MQVNPTPTGGPLRMTASSDLPRDSDSGGLLLIDKPGGVTSHGVVARVRVLAHTRKVGHAGTLDPMATGLLVLGVGRATRLLGFITGTDKEYRATIRLGQGTVSDDSDGEITTAPGVTDTTVTGLPDALARLTGEISQVPAAVSAIKVAGRRAYARVRAGEEVTLTPRQVTIHRLEVLAQRPATLPDGTRVLDLDIVVACSSGTYVRAIARDLGAALGTAGHLTALRRTKVGPFDVAQATTLEDLPARQVGEDRAVGVGKWEPLMTITAACRTIFPAHILDEDSAADLRHGRPVAAVPGEGTWAAFGPEGEAIGLVENRAGRARAVLVLDPA